MTTLRKLVEDKVAGAALGFKEVAGAADLKSILEGRVSYPGCYIYRERNLVSANKGANFISQLKTQSIALIVTTRNVQDVRGGINADACEDYCDLIEAQLLGWQPASYYTPLEYAGGGLVLLKDGFHYWRDAYQASVTIRSNY